MVIQLTGTNRNGSPELSLSGGNSSTFAWSPFGGSAARAGNTTSLPGFNGERQDPLSGVTHLGNGYRAYSPSLHRFTCPDSESPFGGGGINPYTYCDHDPVNNTDPSGHMPKGLAAAEREAALVARRRANMPSAQAESLSTSLSQPSPGVAGASVGSQEMTGVPHQTRRVRAAPENPVQGSSLSPREQYEAEKAHRNKVFESAPSYLWAVSNEQIQQASTKRFNVKRAIELIEKSTQDDQYFKRVDPDLNMGIKILGGRTEKEVSDMLNDYIHKYGTPVRRPMYRGIPKKYVNMTRDVFQENRFTAVTTDLSVAQKFAGKDGEVIKIMGGSPLKIPNIYHGAGGNESEFLFARDTKFKAGIGEKSKMIIYTVQ